LRPGCCACKAAPLRPPRCRDLPRDSSKRCRPGLDIALRLLAPKTLDELEKSADKICPGALAEEDLARPVGVGNVPAVEAAAHDHLVSLTRASRSTPVIEATRR
jgi:hypothetical protein